MAFRPALMKAEKMAPHANDTRLTSADIRS